MKTISRFFCLFCLLFLSGVAKAGDYDWVSTVDGIYGDGSNWSPVGVPGSTDNAYFSVDSAYTVTLDDNYAVSRIKLDAGQATLDLAGYQYDIEWTDVSDNAAIIGYFADAELTLTNGGGVYSGNLIIGFDGISSGILNVRGPDTLWRTRRGTDWYSMFIGGNGRAELNISDGGTMDHGAGSVATHHPSRAFVTVEGLGSLWRVDGYLAMGDQGIAQVNVRDQGMVNVSRCDMGLNPGSQAFMTLVGKDSENNSEFYLRSFSETSLTIGMYGSAHLTCLNNGSVINEGNLAIAAYPGSLGELTLSESAAYVWRSASIGGTPDAAGGTAVVNILRGGLLSVGNNDPDDQLVIWPGGTVNLCEGGLRHRIIEELHTIALHGRLAGTGLVMAAVANPDGVVAPGSGFNMPGDLEIVGGYVQGPAGRLQVTIAGISGTPDSWHGRLDTGDWSTATLDGSLDVATNGYVPSATDSFEIVYAGGGVSGRFVNTPGDVYIGSSGTFDVQYNANSVVLTNYRPLACSERPAADLNGDCQVNMLDFAVVAGQWLADGRQ